MTTTLKTQPIHLILPMSGQGTRFQKAGYTLPKPLIPVGGKPMIQRLLAVFPEHWPATAVLTDSHERTELPATLKRLRPRISLKTIPPHQKGPGHAISQVIDSLPEEAPVLVSYCDYGMIWDANAFENFVRSTDCDACLISYRGFHAHYLSPVPYAYSRMQGERVVEVKEKGWFGNDREKEYASCGAYYFKSVSILKKALQHQERIQLIMNGESYTSLTVQALLDLEPSAHVRVFEIPYFFQWGTPEDLENFEYWANTLSSFSRYSGMAPGSTQVDQVLMPMCGLGSRFTSITATPKPFIQINGKPMFSQALNSLPSGQTNIVALRRHQRFLGPYTSDQIDVKLLESTPEGQALSVAAGVELLSDRGDIIISSCDHGIVLNPTIWNEFRETSSADAAIFTIRGYPGGKRNPAAFAWVELETGTSWVKNVSVKKAISENPFGDHLLVGTFWFRNKTLLVQGLESLITKNIRVNGEVYLDSIFNELIALGKKVEIIPLNGYINWGDPDSLAESLYWQEIYSGRSFTCRSRFPGVNTDA